MPINKLGHHNGCPRCPVIGAEDIPGEEWYQFLSLRCHIGIARELCRPSMLHRVDPSALRRWLESAQIVQAHLEHLPARLGPGIMVMLPKGCGRLIIDGNHRAGRALRDSTDFLAYLLPEKETQTLLQRSMGVAAADHYWKRLTDSKSHPDDIEQGA